MNGRTWREAKTFADVLDAAPTFLRFLGAESVAAMSARIRGLAAQFPVRNMGEFDECAVLNREASKKNALQRLCADFQILPERVVAIGDSPNDVPMLRWAGTGVAMGNAAPEVKQSVRYVTASNDGGRRRRLPSNASSRRLTNVRHDRLRALTDSRVRIATCVRSSQSRDWEALREFSREHNEIPDDVYAQPRHFWEVMLHKMTCSRIDLLASAR